MERTIMVEQGALQVPVKVREPEDGQIQRLVLGVHGIGGSANDDIQTGIAEEMEMFYSASFRFDFPAHGESPLDSEWLTLSNCVDSLLAVARFARERYPEVEDLCVFATGFGAYVTLIALEELVQLPGKVKLVVQTPALRMHETLLAMKRTNRETLWALDKVTFNTKRPFSVTYSFYEELADNVALTSYDVPMLILHGEQDAVIRYEDIQNFRRINDQAKLVIIPGASHRFLEDGAWDMVLDLTRDWFEFEQVLCCDWE